MAQIEPAVWPPLARADLRRFVLRRHQDDSGISGVGVVAEGVVFSDRSAVLHWLTATACVAVYRSLADLLAIHGHGGRTVVEWVDGE